jgi:Protein of unknown function (DUF2997)
MELQELEIQMDREGNVTLHVRGVKGEECIMITKSIEEPLGKIIERTLSGEFYQEKGAIYSRDRLTTD